MTESWRQKQVDIEHWLHGIQTPSPEPSKESDRELTSSSDILASPSLKTSFSAHQPHLQPNPSQHIPVYEPISIVTTPSLLSQPPYDPTPKQGTSKSPTLVSNRVAQKSPLPLATNTPQLPKFVPYVNEDASSREEDLKLINSLINRPPSSPMICTSPVIFDEQGSHATRRNVSSPVAFNPVKIRIKSNLLQTLKVKNETMLSRRKSVSQDNINQLFGKQRKVSKERNFSDSDINIEVCNKHESSTQSSACVLVTDSSDDESDSISSTGACGLGSDLSNVDPAEVGATPVEQKRKMFERGLLSAASMDVLETRLRERKLGIGSADLLSPTSPPARLSRQSRVSRSPSPTRPTSPYHTSIVPLSIHSEASHHTRVGSDNQRGISKSKLKQFNISQQYSFDTTNDDDFNKSFRRPKFLKSNVLIGNSSHVRSYSDVSSVVKATNEARPNQTSHTPPPEGNKRQYKSQLDLSFTKEVTDPEGSSGTKLSMYEQIQLRKAECESNKRVKSKVARQDSGLGTLSTISLRLL